MGRKSIVLDERDCEYIKQTYSYDPLTGNVSLRRLNRITGCLGKNGYKTIFVTMPSQRRPLKAHLIAWLLYYGQWPEFEVDHKNQDKGDNRIDNLRLTTGGQNKANTRKYSSYGKKSTASKYKGVSWHKRDKYWFAYIRVDKKLIQLGKFSTELEAAEAYNRAAFIRYGSFAVLNILPSGPDRSSR
jgi:hypothetical protein